MQIVKLVNGKFVAEDVKGGGNPNGKRHWYEIPDDQYQPLLAIARKDGLDVNADNDRSRTIKENKAVFTIMNLVLEDFITKRKAMEAKLAPAGAK